MIISELGPQVLNARLSDLVKGETTLYSFYKQNINQTQKDVENIWKEHRTKASKKVGYVNALGAYQKIEGGSGPQFNDETIINRLFEQSDRVYVNKIFDYQIKAYGITDDISFSDTFQRARMFAYEAVVSNADVLTEKSFPATFFHKDILMMFEQKVSGKIMGMFDEDYAKKRVEGTGEIILRTLFGAKVLGATKTRILANCLMLAEMHNHVAIGNKKDRQYRHYLYNQSSAAFTLLTFSYFIGKSIFASKAGDKEVSVEEKHWYFFWKALGSTMGVHTYLLPNDHTEAESLWKEFLANEKILANDVLGILVDAADGVKSSQVNIGYTGEGKIKKLCGKTAGEVIKLLDSDGKELIKDTEADFFAEKLSSIKALGADEKEWTKQTITLVLLRNLRHGARLKQPVLKNSELIYLIDLPHLLEIYKTVQKNLSNNEVSLHLKIALFYSYYWTFGKAKK